VFVLWFLAFLVIAPTVFVYFLIIKGMDRYEPEPIWLLSAVFFWGAVVATLISIVMNGNAPEYSNPVAVGVSVYAVASEAITNTAMTVSIRLRNLYLRALTAAPVFVS